MTPRDFAQLVDHTLLKAEATQEQIIALCQEAREMETKSVCVNSLWVSLVAEQLAGSDVLTCTVVGFPLASMNLEGLAEETRAAVNDGAQEVDMVLPLGAFLSGDLDVCEDAIKAVREACPDATLKVILETAALGPANIARACELAAKHGADFVKTSTGFHVQGGATVEAVALMRKTVGDALGVKASGGIRTLKDAQAMVDAGANRLGLSATASIYKELQEL